MDIVTILASGLAAVGGTSTEVAPSSWSDWRPSAALEAVAAPQQAEADGHKGLRLFDGPGYCQTPGAQSLGTKPGLCKVKATFRAQYQAMARLTDYTLDREGINTVDETNFSTGFRAFAELAGLARAYAFSTDSLFPDEDTVFQSRFGSRDPEEIDPDSESLQQILGVGVTIAAFVARFNPEIAARIPTAVYERRVTRGRFTSDRDVIDDADLLIAAANERFTISDNAEVFALQWGFDPRFTASPLYIDESADGGRIHQYYALEYVQYESEVFDNIDDATARISILESESYGLRGGMRYEFLGDDGLTGRSYWSLGADAGFAVGDRTHLRAGAYVGHFLQSASDCVYQGCISFSITLGAFIDQTDFADDEGGPETNGGREIGEFETVSTNWALEATAGLSVKF